MANFLNPAQQISCLNIYGLFYFFVYSSSACRKDQFAVSYLTTNNVRFVPLGCVLALENSFDLTTLCSVSVQQIEPRTRQNWSPYFFKVLV